MIEEDDTRKREYASLLEIADNYEKWVVTLDEIQYPIFEGIKHIQAWNLNELLYYSTNNINTPYTPVTVD